MIRLENYAVKITPGTTYTYQILDNSGNSIGKGYLTMSSEGEMEITNIYAVINAMQLENECEIIIY